MMRKTGVILPSQSEPLMRPMIVIGIPGDKRASGIQQARSDLGMPPAIILSYAEFLQGRSLGDLMEEQKKQLSHQSSVYNGVDLSAAPPLLRLESPGSSFEVERALIALGAPDSDDMDDSLHPYADRPDPRPLRVQVVRQLKEMQGVLHHPSQWFRGYCRMLARLQREAKTACPGSLWLNDPTDIAAMTDKRQTQQILSEAGIPIPRPVGEDQQPTDYASLREMMISRRMHRVFIKLAFGSAASGVIAYQLHPVTGAEVALTTVGVENYITRPPIYYNSGKLRRYTDTATISGIINWIYRHGGYAEQWIPKIGHNGKAFDIRQLVVLREACHAIARVSSTPITNLHLRSQRMSPSEAGLSEFIQEQVRNTALQALAAFPRSGVAGIDVLISGGSQQCFVADVNPFGDLLYDVKYRGCSTYEWEMKVLTARDYITHPSTPLIKEGSS
ncbi:STM4014 family protein [Paenibacillus sp. FSL P4-0502]|uniref:STM4014 family protein n=1 Tax=Paenibacillus sp. FSL P4-0502 TaxID=2975319 RepID=UPI0030F5D94C